MTEKINPFDCAIAVTKSDSTVLSLNDEPPRALFVGTGGNVNVQFGDLVTSVLFKNVASGTILWIRPSRVMSASTTAADMVALY